MYNRLYVHVPFCLSKCNYCAFISSKPTNNELTEYPTLLMREMQLQECCRKPVTSIYFGGGTPSLLQPTHIAKLLDEIARQSGISSEAEITLEVNPGTVDFSVLELFRSIGINRISLGVQSFDDAILNQLGRIHSVEQSLQTFRNARKAGFNNVSIDLIHSLPRQDLDKWRYDLQQAIQLYPEHISIYGLTVEDDTPFQLLYPSGSPDLADEDLSADMFELADELLTNSGFEHYEIANYAQPGYHSQHNCGYWNRDGYLGLGVAAHSFLRDGYGVRFSNQDNLKEYRQSVSSGQLKRIDEHHLTQEEAMAEYIFLGLRLANGINFQAFRLEFGNSLESVYGALPDDLIKLGLLTRNDIALKLTNRGMLLSNQVFSKFIQ